VVTRELGRCSDRLAETEPQQYHHHESLELEEVSQNQGQIQSGMNTPPDQIEDDNIHPLNYQRKRQATSPAVDLRHEQENIYQRIKEMSNTVQTLTNTITQLTELHEEGSQNTTSPNSNQ
jgi:uncharacterized membrane-anchored protein YjiN (DUF445 family)